MKTILLTWATWYIGSHQAVALLEKWYNVIIVDNLSNSNKSSLEAIEKILQNSPLLFKRGARGELLKGLYEEINLWTGKATSVLEMIEYANKATWKNLKYKIVDRRPWDIATSYCNPEKAKKLLNWEAKYSVEEAIKDSWNFIRKKSI